MRRSSLVVLSVLAVLAGTVALLPAQAGATTPSTDQAAYDAQVVYRMINHERAVHDIAALRWSIRLTMAAHSHNLLMAKYNTLSHQLPGEPSLGTRVHDVNYDWRTVGENIGVTQDWSLTGIISLQKSMYHEVAPNDWHRRNILCKSYRSVGVDVYMDSRHHKAWLTEVFAAPF